MALPLLLPLLGAVGAGVTGAVRGQRQQQGREQAASDIMTLTGQTGPRAGMEPTQQRAAFSALSSRDPLARQVAMQAMTPADPMAEAMAFLEMQQAQADLAQTRQETAGMAQQQGFDESLFETRFGQERVALAQAQQDLAQGAMQPGVPPGDQPLVPEVVAMPHPVTGRPSNVQIAGADYQKQQAQVDAAQRAIRNINTLVELVNTYGSEGVGEIATQMSQLQTEIIFDAITAKGGGAPQEAEIEAMRRGLPDPTGIGQNIRGAAQSVLPFGDSLRGQQIATITSGYEQLAMGISQSVLDAANINPALRVDYGALNQGIFQSDAERELYESTTGDALVRFLITGQ